MEHFPPIEEHLIPSKHIAQTFKVQVMRPARARGDAARYPVIYATDGNLSFDMLKGLSYVMQSSDDAPRFILIGIGYPGDCPRAGAILRGRDFTFPGYPRLSRAGPPIEGVLPVAPGTPDFDGAAAFQRFFADELIPFIDERFETQQGQRTYFGHSAGGGFGLHTLFSRPELFARYIISSPGLSFHGVSSAGVRYDDYDFAFDEAHRFLACRHALPDTTLFLSVGSEEEHEREYAEWRLTSSVNRMAMLLRSVRIPGLRFVTEVFRGATHMTAWPMAFLHGVQAVFASGQRDA